MGVSAVIRTVALAALCIVSALEPASAQPNWASANPPGCPNRFFHNWSTDSQDTIFFGGYTSDCISDWQTSNAVYRYAGGQWDTMGHFNGILYSVVQFHDTIVAGGYFSYVDSIPCTSSAAYYDGEWHPYGSFTNSIRTYRIIENELYALGDFYECDGQPAVGIAKRIGGQWVPVGTMQVVSPPVGMFDLVKYQGTLVATGGFTIIGDEGDDIAYLNGTEWQILGPGIVGGMSGSGPMAVYQGDLYVGGQFSTASGNAGQSIMRWDGTQFHPVDDGLRYALGATSPTCSVTSMLVHDGHLFVAGGGWRYAGGILANALATWDGNEWCSVPGNVYPGIYSMAFYQDTLFIASENVIEGDTVDYAAKFVGPTYFGTCSGPLGLGEYDDPFTTCTIHPNPANSFITVDYSGQDASRFAVTDVLGRTVLSGTYSFNIQVDVSGLAVGTYNLLLFNSPGAKVGMGRFVRE